MCLSCKRKRIRKYYAYIDIMSSIQVSKIMASIVNKINYLCDILLATRIF